MVYLLFEDDCVIGILIDCVLIDFTYRVLLLSAADRLG
jgi:hypothetical protein